jgi:dipeptidyl-peptidase 4
MTTATTTRTPDSFPRRSARTARFTSGAPRAFQVARDGRAVAFLRSASGTARAAALWVVDPATGAERQVAEPSALLDGGAERLTAQERSRRERMRESGAGITAYSVDEAFSVAAFALSSRLFVASLAAGEADPVRELATVGPVVDPQLSPDGRWVGYGSGGGLHVVPVDGGAGHPLAGPDAADGPDVTWGLADFAAAEELARFRGFWWGPSSAALLVARVDESAVRPWHIGDPANPDADPVTHRYPAAGTPNADVSLWLVDIDGGRRQVGWDSARHPYLATVHWSRHGPALLLVVSRRQDSALTLAVDLSDGSTELLREQTDPCWVDVVPGAPAWTSDGALLTVEVDADRYALCVDGVPVSPTDVQVRQIAATGDAVLVHASTGLGEDRVYTWSRSDDFTPVVDFPGSHAATGGAGTVVVASSPPDDPGTTFRILRSVDGGTPGAPGVPIGSLAEDPGLRPAPELLRVGSSGIPTGVLLPTGWRPSDGPLPVLLDPYGGPHHAEVHVAARGWLESQWWADQGFVVVVADGRGTPGTPSWERAVRWDLAGPPLEDQVEVLQVLAKERPGVLDPARVAIRGWSFGGYLAALAVLRRPDVFHAAVAGAPVTDWRLYDTAYTERYLGLPDEHPDAYDAGSLVRMAGGLTRPLMIVHGLADDNVVAAHSLRLSSALLAAGKPHTFLPLSGVTHMTPQEVVAENLLLLQLDFLRRALGL